MFAAALWAEASGAPIQGALSLAPTGADQSISIERSARGFVLQGRAQRIPWASQVGHVLVYARDSSGAGHLVLLQSAGGTHATSTATSPTRRATRCCSTTSRVPAEAVRPAPPTCAEGFLLFGALIRAQQMVGAMERCLDYALAYAMERQQFGRPIGKFQAVQHMLADAAGQYAAAAAAAELAAEAYGNAGLRLCCRHREGARRRGRRKSRGDLPSGARCHRFHARAPAAFRHAPSVVLARRVRTRNLLAGTHRSRGVQRRRRSAVADAGRRVMARRAPKRPP